MQGCRITGMQRCRDKGMWGCRDSGTWVQGCRYTGMQGCRLQGHRNAGLQGCRDLGIQQCRDAGIQECRDCRNAGIQGVRDAPPAVTRRWHSPSADVAPGRASHAGTPPKKERGDSSLPGKPRKISHHFSGKAFVQSYFCVESRQKKGTNSVSHEEKGKNSSQLSGHPLSVSPWPSRMGRASAGSCSLPGALLPCSHIPAVGIFLMETAATACASSSSSSQRFFLQEQLQQQQHKKQEGAVAEQGQGALSIPPAVSIYSQVGSGVFSPQDTFSPPAPWAALAEGRQLHMGDQVGLFFLKNGIFFPF